MKKILLGLLSLSMISCLSVGAIVLASATTPVSLESFSMGEGASVREMTPTGIRFKTYISNADFATLPSDAKFGTLVIPRSVLGSATEITKETQNVLDIECNTWYDENYNDGKLFTGVLLGTNNGDYLSEHYEENIVAQSYVTYTDPDTSLPVTVYAKNPQERSIAYVASAALANGETSKVLTDIVDAVAPATLDMTDVTLGIGETVTPSLVGCNLVAVYTSSNASVIEVKDGKLIGKSAGSAQITVQLGSFQTTETVTVADKSWHVVDESMISTDVETSQVLYYLNGNAGANHNNQITVATFDESNASGSGISLLERYSG